MSSHIDNKISFEYEFVTDKSMISNKDKKDVAKILNVDATFTIKINDELYFKEDLPILEFYKTLFLWKEEVLKKSDIPEFHYYSIEYDEYEDGSILSLIPFGNKARVKSIWAKQEMYNVFPLDYIVNEFLLLEEKLKKDIEHFYDIQFKKFLKHIPIIIVE